LIRKAIIPAAGYGTRFLPASKAIPKELIPVVDKPTIQYVVEEAVAAGINEILIIISRGKEAICSHFNPDPVLEDLLRRKGRESSLDTLKSLQEKAQIHFIYQEEMKGLGDAVLCARDFAGQETVAILLGDTILHHASPPSPLEGMMEVHRNRGGSVIAVRRVPRQRVSQYGVISGQPIDPRLTRIQGMVEKPKPEEAPSLLAVSARYLVTPQLFECLADTLPGVGGEIQITDALDQLCRREVVYGYEFDGIRLDIGNQLEYIKSNLMLGLHEPAMREALLQFMVEQVSIHGSANPATSEG